MSDFLTPLDVEFIDGRLWRLTTKLSYRLGTPDGLWVVEVPAGFVTDFASIPRILWNILPPIGLYGKAAVVHDYLYQQRRVWPTNDIGPCAYVDRAEADQVLFEAMGVLGVNLITRLVIYAGVRIGGWLPWGNARKKERQS